MARRRRDAGGSSNGYIVHRPKPKAKKPTPNASDGRTFTVHAPKRSRPRDAKTIERPNAYVLHRPRKSAAGKLHSPNGSCWTYDGLGSWLCDYGCKAIRVPEEPDNDDWHSYDCPYWWNEGRDETPF